MDISAGDILLAVSMLGGLLVIAWSVGRWTGSVSKTLENHAKTLEEHGNAIAAHSAELSSIQRARLRMVDSGTPGISSEA